MKFRTLTLATTSLVALGLALSPASAKTGMMGDVTLAYGFSWDNFEDSSGFSTDEDFAALLGQGRVNLPYSDTVNVQLDINGRASMDEVFGNKSSHFGLGGHINYRDAQGVLGVFAGAGRVQDSFFFSAPVFMAGFEGQYFCNEWTLSAQAGYLDSDQSALLANAGFVQVGANYYASKKLKLTGSLAYINGEQNTFFTSVSADVEEWAWSVGIHYWFGVSIPVSGFIEYKGRTADTDFGGEGSATLDEHTVNAGVTFHFGGDGFQDADRNGASGNLPDMDWYKLSTGGVS